MAGFDYLVGVKGPPTPYHQTTSSIEKERWMVLEKWLSLFGAFQEGPYINSLYPSFVWGVLNQGSY